jgi:hypothetical protein
MQPMASIWYGVDPLAEKYPYVSGYVYCTGNPIKLIDMLGEEPDGYEGALMSALAYYGYLNGDHVNTLLDLSKQSSSGKTIPVCVGKKFSHSIDDIIKGLSKMRR